jgi:hypothetical protein
MLALVLALSLAIQAPGLPPTGVASWYDATRQGQSSWYTRAGINFYGAVGSWRWGDNPYSILVCTRSQPTRCVIVTVVDYCGRCAQDLRRTWTKKSRAIDLSPAAFARLRDLSTGLVAVTIKRLQQGR